jgi:hypothetical protein
MRLRIVLRGRSQALFTEELTARDRIFVSSAHRLELTELRLNEHRSFPPSIAQNAQKNAFKIKRVHYFLIRELGHALVTQHPPLRKVRRLEANLWASYLRGRAVTDREVPAEEKLASRMVIYHWRADATTESPINDFTAFASFQTNATGLLFYLIAITLLGAIGGALSDWGEGQFGLKTSFWIWTVALFVLWLLAWSGVWSRFESALGASGKALVRAVTYPFRSAAN